MGLMYVFPVSEEETDFVKKDGALTLKTYGLPYIFWIYALCIVAVIFFMFLAIKEPVLKLIQLGDETDATLGYSLLTFIGLMPVFIFAFFFYEKRIVKDKRELRLVHRVFGITVFSEKFIIENNDQLVVEPFLTSPNVARMKGGSENVGFQNKGYFILWLKSADGKQIQIDRHSRKADLDKLKALLEKN
ncbi:MAG: hypothetical protein ACLGHN_00600 [Bacteriovoracia bacterium]